MTRSESDSHPYLDEPVAFAHDLYSQLAAGGDSRLVAAGPSTFEAFDNEFTAVRDALPAEVPELGRLLAEVSNCAYDMASDQHSVGVEFGVAAEQLRHSLLSGATGPRIPWQPTVLHSDRAAD